MIMQLFQLALSNKFFLLIVICLCTLNMNCHPTNAFIYSKHQLNSTTVPALFAFGDSLVDTGNNNDLLTLGRCNFPPYGKDFEDQKATGRFSNGKLTIDFYVEKLGIKNYVPAFLDPSLKSGDLLTGVSFASAASGYDPSTSKLAYVRSMKEQLNMLKRYRCKIRAIAGITRAQSIIKSSIFIVTAGSSDLTNNYFGDPARRDEYNVSAYTNFMINRASSFVKKLYRQGARKIGVSNIPPLDIMPYARTLAGGQTRECARLYNQAVELFNTKLNIELQYLSHKLPSSKLVYIDTNSIMLDILENRTQYGFEVVDRGCCGSGLIEAGPLCNPFSALCGDVKTYMFWDSYNPTEAVNKIIATQVLEKHFPDFF